MQDLTPPFHFTFEKKIKVKKVRDLPIGLSIPYTKIERRAVPLACNRHLIVQICRWHKARAFYSSSYSHECASYAPELPSGS